MTCYDAATARLIDEAGIDMALAGDSLANTRLGYPNTIPISLEEMIHHTKAAARGIKRALLVADLPFLSYEAASWEAAIAAGRLIKEGGAHAVKMEGGRRVANSVKALINANIPVMGHLGLTPQSIHMKGGYHVQGRKPPEANAIMADAKLLQYLGVFCLVLEGIPAPLGRCITKTLKIPTIGIGAGPDCDGQILVLDDMLGISEGPTPKFVKKYADLNKMMKQSVAQYIKEVRSHRFPATENCY